MPKVVRRQTPPPFSRYQDYKPFLRLDFLHRCSYCGVREASWGGQTHFHVDHFKPKSMFPELETMYFNLYYSCDRCNTYKRAFWPTATELTHGQRFYDACIDRSKHHFRMETDGSLSAISPCGTYSLQRLRLNRATLTQLRNQRLEFIVQYRMILRNERFLRLRFTESTSEDRDALALAIRTIAIQRRKYRNLVKLSPMD